MTRRVWIYVVVALVLIAAVSWPASGNLWAQDDEPTEEEAQETAEAADRLATRQARTAEAGGEESTPAESTPGAPPTEVSTAVPPTVIPSATPTAYPLRSLTFNLLTQADVSVTTSGPVVVSAATIVLQPGMATVSFITDGETIIAPSVGAVSLTADQGVLGVADISSAIGLDTVSGTPEALDAVTIGPGTQAHLPAGTTASLRNDSAAAVTLLIVTIVPAG